MRNCTTLQESYLTQYGAVTFNFNKCLPGMLSACLCVYADKFTVRVQKCPPHDRMHASERLLCTCPMFSETVMVSVGVSKLGCTEFFFVEPGVKINGAYYRDVLLTQKLLPAIRQISGNEFVFQQDSAPAHRAHETIELLCRDTYAPDFISPEQWPPNSPDLNPVDYKI